MYEPTASVLVPASLFNKIDRLNDFIAMNKLNTIKIRIAYNNLSTIELSLMRVNFTERRQNLSRLKLFKLFYTAEEKTHEPRCKSFHTPTILLTKKVQTL
jgi:hypothetical protein